MGKIVKSIASVVLPAIGFAIGSLIGGPIVGALLASAVSVGTSALLKPKAPRNSPEALDRLRANLDPRTPRKTVVGITAMATDIRDEEFTDSQEYFHRFIVTSSHKAESHDEIWFDDKRVWTSSGGVEGEAVGYLEVQTRYEGSAANAINISSRMGSTRRYTGLSYVHLKYKLTGNSKKAESPYAQGITTRITIRGKGAAIYDPRVDSTVDGGSGAQRADDQSTWVWDDDACRNPALALLFYLLGYRITNPSTSEDLLAVGKGIPPDRIDLESFAIAANICDEDVGKVGGGTEPRYRCDGVWSEGDSPTTVIDMLKATMNADLDDVGGKLRLTVFHDDLADIVTDFDDDDIIDGFEWQAVPPLDQTFNIVQGAFTDPSDESLYQQVDYPLQEAESPDGIDRIDTFNLPMVQSVGQAQRLAAMRLERQKYGGVFTAEYQATAWKVQKNSVVRQSFKQTGFVDKLFRVAEMEIRQDGVVPLVLREENAAIYTPPSLASAIAPVASTPYDPSKNPLIQAVLAGEVNLIATSSQPGLTVSATDTSITISDHVRQYTDLTVSVTGATLTEDSDSNPLAETTTYYLYYNDAARAGGSVTWYATTSFNEAQTKASTPARHFGGYITTDVNGGGGTTGGGSVPPGSGGTDPGTWDP